MNTEIIEKIKEITSKQIGINKEKIDENVNLVEEYEADSLDIFEIVNEVEEEFNVLIPEGKKIVSISDLATIIEEEVNE